MHRDKKLGLALGVLLIGIVGAFFFRLDPVKRPRVPTLASELALNKQMSEKSGSPYTDDSEPIKGSEQNNNHNKAPEPPLWHMPDFLADGQTKMPEDWLAETPTTPDPIPEWQEVVAEAEPADDESFAANDDESFEADHKPEQIAEPEQESSFVENDTPNEEPQERPQPQPKQNVQPKIVQNVTESKPKKPAAPAEEFRIHVVRPGDTLSKIAANYLGSSARFNDIYALNREVLADPNNLSVGTELRIPKKAQPAGQQKQNSVFRNANERHKIESTNVSRSKVLPPNQSAPAKANSGNGKPASPKKFVPVTRNPLNPGRRDQTSENTAPGKQTLSQVPPADLPEID